MPFVCLKVRSGVDRHSISPSHKALVAKVFCSSIFGEMAGPFAGGQPSAARRGAHLSCGLDLVVSPQ
jgi:hypothetical protein